MLDCGKPVASSVVDSLPSIMNRHSYPHVPEPEVAMIFRTKGSTEVDMNQLEMQLRAAKKEVRNVFLYFCRLSEIVEHYTAILKWGTFACVNFGMLREKFYHGGKLFSH